MVSNAHSSRKRSSRHPIEKSAISYKIKQTLRSELQRHAESPERLGMPSMPPVRLQRFIVAEEGLLDISLIAGSSVLRFNRFESSA